MLLRAVLSNYSGIGGMDPEQKKIIIKRLIEQESLPQPFVLADELVEQVPYYTQLSYCLDRLEDLYPNLLGFDFKSVTDNSVQWDRVTRLLTAGLMLEIGAPSQIVAADLDAMKKEAAIIIDTLFIDTLPQPDYYNRITHSDPSLQLMEIDPLISAARDKLAAILTEPTKKTGFDNTNNGHIEKLIKQLQNELKQAKRNRDSVRAQQIENQIVVAEDLLKVNQLSAIIIPGEHGSPSMTYCTLAESAGGVTEKVSLISLDRVKEQLGNLGRDRVSDIESYMRERSKRYKLSTEAILKLPKHGRIEEVQRESFALNMARILELDTTRSSMLMHDGKPALFVPFDDIELMRNFAKGKVLRVFASEKTYEHYSTINPVGAGLQADSYVDDFGNALSLFYVCSDPDSMGGYNQNKALRNAHSLFIFDQVAMSSENFKLDSRLSLQPSGFMAHSRHGQGRNRTLIEDSAFNSKFASLLTLMQNKQKINRYFERAIKGYDEKITTINQEIARRSLSGAVQQQLETQKKQLVALRGDAVVLQKTIQDRIENIGDVLPLRSEDLSLHHVRQAMILEKLLHNPRLFTDSGRPYKNPWTYRHNNPVKSIDSREDKLLITLSNELTSTAILSFIKRVGHLDSLKKISPFQLIISQEDLNKLNENMLYPETRLSLDHAQDYLDPSDLLSIGQAYGSGKQEAVLKTVKEYRTRMTHDESAIDLMDNLESALHEIMKKAEDKGFAMHVIKKMHFDFQQRLQKILPHTLKFPELDEAFIAAMKLDQVSLFNQVIVAAVRSARRDPQLKFSTDIQPFLQECIQAAANATNHTKAVDSSNAIASLAVKLISSLKGPKETLPAIDPKIAENPEQQQRQVSVEAISLPVAPLPVEPVVENTPSATIRVP